MAWRSGNEKASPTTETRGPDTTDPPFKTGSAEMGLTSAGVTRATDFVSPESNGSPTGATQSLWLFPPYAPLLPSPFSRQQQQDVDEGQPRRKP